MSAESHRRSIAYAEVLRWQSRVRLTVATMVGGAALALQSWGLIWGDPIKLTFVVVGYLATIVATVLVLYRTRRATAWMVAGTILADLLFVFGSTIVASPPAYYDRVLIFAFFVLHLTETYFGRGYASLALGAVVVGYSALVAGAIVSGAPLEWPQELWSLSVFAIGGSMFIAQYGSFRRRLSGIASLFELAEEGDFTRAYDVEADTRPDAITLVGRAYNRVRSQLSSMVLTDPLTGCLNRRGFEQALAREVARSGRAGSEFALLALDLDHFKLVNDTHGHMAGDVVLREAASLLQHAARAGDVVARTGGEEFSIVLPDTDARGAFQFAARLCDMMRTHRFQVNGERFPLTVSIGVVASAEDVRPATGPEVADQLRHRADDALYTAKRSGRDRARMWKDGMSTNRSGSGETLAIRQA